MRLTYGGPSLSWDRDNHNITVHLLLQPSTHPPTTHTHNLVEEAYDLYCRAAVNLPVIWVCDAAGMWNVWEKQAVGFNTLNPQRKMMTIKTQHWILLGDEENHHLSLSLSVQLYLHVPILTLWIGVEPTPRLNLAEVSQSNIFLFLHSLLHQRCEPLSVTEINYLKLCHFSRNMTCAWDI